MTLSSVRDRTCAWLQAFAEIDRRVMSQAVIMPGVYARSLLYRNPNLTNVFVHKYYAMYNYSTLGLK